MNSLEKLRGIIARATPGTWRMNRNLSKDKTSGTWNWAITSPEYASIVYHSGAPRLSFQDGDFVTTFNPKTVALLLDVVEAASGWGNEVPEEITASLKALDEHLGTSEITPQTDPKELTKSCL